MSKSGLLLAEGSATPQSARCSGSGKVIALITLFIGVSLAAVVLSPLPFTRDTDGQFEKPANTMLAVPGHTGIVPPLAGSRTALGRPSFRTNAMPNNFMQPMQTMTRSGGFMQHPLKMYGMQSHPSPMTARDTTVRVTPVAKERKTRDWNDYWMLNDPRKKKRVDVKIVQQKLNAANMVILTKWNRLDTWEQNDIRNMIRQSGEGANWIKTKNSLLARSLQGTKNQEFVDKDLLWGCISVAYSNEPVNFTKTVLEIPKDKELQIGQDDREFEVLGGILDGQFLDPDGLQKLSKMKTMKEYYAEIAGCLKQPATKIAIALQEARGAKLARAINLVKEKMEEEKGGGDA